MSGAERNLHGLNVNSHKPLSSFVFLLQRVWKTAVIPAVNFSWPGDPTTPVDSDFPGRPTRAAVENF